MRRALPAAALTASLLIALPAAATASEPDCLDTGAGVTANHVNEVPDDTVVVTCDVGVFVDQDMVVDGLDVLASQDDAPSQRYGLMVVGAEVTLSDVHVTSPDDYARQFIGIQFRDAVASLDDSTISGAHRAGIVVRGPSADVDIRRVEVVGVGVKTTGWAQNGIQVDQGAQASVRDSLVEGHFWGKNDYVSTGLFAYGGVLHATGNTLVDNDANVILFSTGSQATRNTITNTVSATAPDGSAVEQYGVLVSGDDNKVVRNTVTATDGTVGVYIYAGSVGTKLIRNDISGWDTDVEDNGEATKRPNPIVG